MSIPSECDVLVVGGGPAGSYAACVLAREGIDAVVLEAESMPRYHVGESMMPSFRYYLRFIDLESAVDNYGFTIKNGAAWKLTAQDHIGYTDFTLKHNGGGSVWNMVRSELDELMFRYAENCGAKTFEGAKVTSVNFADDVDGSEGEGGTCPGRPVSAVWSRKKDGTSGTIKFKYIIDATGRAGLLNTKYLKDRRYNAALKNIAHWAYYRGSGVYGENTEREGVPVFEALRDESGWAWFIPLHDGTHSVGLVMNQDISTKKRKSSESLEAYFTETLDMVPMVRDLIGKAERVSEVKSASDYSYYSDSYAFPNARIIGDAGCFIDPVFSSGVHLACTGGLSAAVTIAAAMRGDVDEAAAAKWHSRKIKDCYTRFLMVVLCVYKQMNNQQDPVMSDFSGGNFDRAFLVFKPIIQGTVDTANGVSQAEFSKTIDYLVDALVKKYYPQDAQKERTKEEKEIIDTLREQQASHWYKLSSWTTDVVNGLVPRMEVGSLTLVSPSG